MDFSIESTIRVSSGYFIAASYIFLTFYARSFSQSTFQKLKMVLITGSQSNQDETLETSVPHKIPEKPYTITRQEFQFLKERYLGNKIDSATFYSNAVKLIGLLICKKLKIDFNLQEGEICEEIKKMGKIELYEKFKEVINSKNLIKYGGGYRYDQNRIEGVNEVQGLIDSIHVV